MSVIKLYSDFNLIYFNIIQSPSPLNAFLNFFPSRSLICYWFYRIKMNSFYMHKSHSIIYGRQIENCEFGLYKPFFMYNRTHLRHSPRDQLKYCVERGK